MERTIEASAVLSPCGLYRYSLTRLWDESKPGVLFIMLNPSMADAYADDPTIRRCRGYARAWDCGSVTVVNLFAYRATDPTLLICCAQEAPRTAIGPDNDKHIRAALKAHSGRGDYIVAAWGVHGGYKALRKRRDEVMRFLPLADLMCLDVTAKGDPRHPLYCRQDLGPTLYKSMTRKPHLAKRGLPLVGGDEWSSGIGFGSQAELPSKHFQSARKNSFP